MPRSQRLSNRIGWQRIDVNQMKDVSQIAPQHFFFVGGKSERLADALLGWRARVLQSPIDCLSSSSRNHRKRSLRQVVAQKFDGISIAADKSSDRRPSASAMTPIPSVSMSASNAFISATVTSG